MSSHIFLFFPFLPHTSWSFSETILNLFSNFIKWLKLLLLLMPYCPVVMHYWPELSTYPSLNCSAVTETQCHHLSSIWNTTHVNMAWCNEASLNETPKYNQDHLLFFPFWTSLSYFMLHNMMIIWHYHYIPMWQHLHDTSVAKCLTSKHKPNMANEYTKQIIGSIFN